MARAFGLLLCLLVTGCLGCRPCTPHDPGCVQATPVDVGLCGAQCNNTYTDTCTPDVCVCPDAGVAMEAFPQYPVSDAPFTLRVPGTNVPPQASYTLQNASELSGCGDPQALRMSPDADIRLPAGSGVELTFRAPIGPRWLLCYDGGNAYPGVQIAEFNVSAAGATGMSYAWQPEAAPGHRCSVDLNLTITGVVGVVSDVAPCFVHCCWSGRGGV